MGLGARILGGPGSRLWNRLRESTGLSYSAGAFFEAATWDRRATLTLSAEVNPRNLARAEAALREELDQSVTQGFGADEVEGFKRQWLADRERERSGDAWAPAPCTPSWSSTNPGTCGRPTIG
jgi:zinc protease